MAKIAMIDDDVKLSGLLKDYLKSFSFELISFDHPDSGLKALRESAYDALILDLMLPGKNGLEVCQEIRKFSDLPIIMLTARGELTDRVLGLELGADDYLPKPFEPRE